MAVKGRRSPRFGPFRATSRRSASADAPLRQASTSPPSSVPTRRAPRVRLRSWPIRPARPSLRSLPRGEVYGLEILGRRISGGRTRRTIRRAFIILANDPLEIAAGTAGLRDELRLPRAQTSPPRSTRRWAVSRPTGVNMTKLERLHDRRPFHRDPVLRGGRWPPRTSRICRRALEELAFFSREIERARRLPRPSVSAASCATTMDEE